MNPLLSVVVPVLEAEAALQHTLASCAGADWLEVIVQDGTPGAASGQTDRVHRFAEADTGIYDAMNKGRTKASGRWILFAGAGDRVGDLEGVQNALLSGHPEVHVFRTALGTEREAGVPMAYAARWDRSMIWRNTVHHQGVCYRADALPQAPFDRRWRVLADYALHLAMWRAGARAMCHEVTAMEVAPDGVSRRFVPALYAEEWRMKRDVLGAAWAVLQVPWLGAKWAFKQGARLRR